MEGSLLKFWHSILAPTFKSQESKVFRNLGNKNKLTIDTLQRPRRFKASFLFLTLFYLFQFFSLKIC
jgi:hypothetical protein